MYADVFHGYDPEKGQSYTVNRQNVMGHWIESGPRNYISSNNSKPSSVQSNYATTYTPNQFTANQLANFNSSVGGGGNTIPAWMHNAFANKMGRMGAPTTEPFPYQITVSSFRGMPAGKAAPTGGQ